MMMDVESMANTAPKNLKVLKKSGGETEGESVPEFALLLAEPETNEIPVFQRLEKTSAKSGEVFQWPEDVPVQNADKISEGESPFSAGDFMPVTELRVFRRVAMNSPPEPAVEREAAASMAALEGKSSVTADAIPRAPVPQEIPVLQPGFASEKTIRLEQLADRFDQRLLSMVQHNEKVMRITVQPATMGRLTVLCREENSKLSVEIIAQTSGVRELIAGQEGAVRRLLQEHSVELGSFDVLMDQEQSGGRNFGSSPGSEHREARGTAPALIEEEDLHALRAMHKSGAVSLIA
ncbi:flagellar hook-length control protein FliK [Pontiellaceae bacterium B12219]|nr:flagellar hook-length control protein FliK [Pontiellaceae bacterium B12219]